jgi:hypothetical protein
MPTPVGEQHDLRVIVRRGFQDLEKLGVQGGLSAGEAQLYCFGSESF